MVLMVDGTVDGKSAPAKVAAPVKEAPKAELAPAKSLLAGGEKAQADASVSVDSGDDEEDCEGMF